MFGKSTLTFDRSKLLGTGAYGTVFEGQWRGIPVAVKRVMKNSTNERKKTLLKLNHRNVIKLFHIDSDQDFK
jgi:serine/threonine protein kinase